MIQVKDIVLHSLSGLYFICENRKMERWMNENPYYRLMPPDVVARDYFFKN